MGFHVKQYTIQSNKVTNQIRMAFLSDLHLTEHGAGNENLIREIDQLEPDLILIGGDMVIGREDCTTAVAEELLANLTRKYPVWYALGNHEERLKEKVERFGDTYEWYRRRLISMGVQLLDNTYQNIEVKGNELSISGLSLPLDYFKRFVRKKLPLEEINELLGKPDETRFQLLLAHHPRYAETYFAWGADLVLSGHIHGGVMRLGKQPVISPDFQLFPKYGYGKFEKENQCLLISGGLGEHTIPFRLFNPKELVLVDIISK